MLFYQKINNGYFSCAHAPALLRLIPRGHKRMIGFENKVKYLIIGKRVLITAKFTLPLLFRDKQINTRGFVEKE